APWPATTDKQKPLSVTNVALTHGGLAALGAPAEALATFPPEVVRGMPSRAAMLGDSGASAPERWELGGPANPPIHLVVMVGALDQAAVDAAVAELRASLGAERGVVEVGLELGHGNSTFTEHFGFSADGISQPVIEGFEGDQDRRVGMLAAGEVVLGHPNVLGIYPLSPAVDAANDPHAILPAFPEGALPEQRDLGRNGSYLVYRKLAQDVAGFWRYLQAQVDGSSSIEAGMIALAAKLMGRWPSGTSLVLAPGADDASLAGRNDFLYRPTDELGYACPMSAHIRRVNPRDSLHRVRDTGEESLHTSSQHRILRRGISYGDRFMPEGDVVAGRPPLDAVDDGGARGVHFLALNADIERQFEFIQETWINDPSFNGFDDDKDPIVGDNDGTGSMTIQRHAVRQRLTNVPRFVTVRGGAYLFLPSMSALRFLSS
ncbi:MAG: hypothetical protein QOE63_533, partial [Acidimicrobiaceae bacterium]